MDSPDGNPVAATPGSSSPAVQESPFFRYISNLSPIKLVKTVDYAQTFSKNRLPIPSPVFTSPRIDVLCETNFQRRSNIDSQGTNACGQYQTQVEGVTGCSFDKEVETCCSSGFVDEYLLEPADMNVCAGSSDLCSTSDNVLLQSLPRDFSVSKESNSKTSFATDCNMESGIEAMAVAKRANFPEPQRLMETTIDYHCRDDERLKDFDEFLDKNFTHLFESPMNLDPFSVAKDCKLPQFVEAFQDSDHKSRAGSSRINKGIRRHLQFEPTKASETTPTCGECDLKQKSSSLAFRENVAESFISSPSETPTITGKWPTYTFEDIIDYGSSLSPVGMVKSTKNLDDSTNPVVQRGIGLHLNSIASGSYMQSRNIIVSNLHSMEDKCENMRKISMANEKTTCTSWGGSENICLRGLNEQQECQPGLEVTPYEGKNHDSQNPDMMDLKPNKISPKNKRKKPASASEDNCNHCNCKRSKCLKLYCECFAAGIFCPDSCACENCLNKPIFEKTVLGVRQQIESRNPLAFVPRVVNHPLDSPTTVVEEGNKTTPSSGRHKKGCNCKKSKCLKKYCECYQAEVRCADGCRCEGCQNSYGTKTENRAENQEKKLSNNKADLRHSIQRGNDASSSAPRKVLTEITNINPVAASPTRSCTKSKTQLLGTGSHRWQHSPITLKPWLQRCGTSQEPTSEESLYDIKDDTTPEILNLSSNKNFLPPRFGQESLSSTPRLSSITSRKIILQAVPSFPSLTPYKDSDNNGLNQAECSENGTARNQ